MEHIKCLQLKIKTRATSSIKFTIGTKPHLIHIYPIHIWNSNTLLHLLQCNIIKIKCKNSSKHLKCKILAKGNRKMSLIKEDNCDYLNS